MGEYSSVSILLCQGKISSHYSTWELVRVTLFFRGRAIMYDVAPLFSSSTVIAVFGLYFGPLVSPLYATLIVKSYL